MSQHVISNDATKPLDVTVAGLSPHVVAYRMWYQKPGDAGWTKFAEGHTGDPIPDQHQTGPLPDQTQIKYWLGFAGHPSSHYQAAVTFKQDGQVVNGGLCTVQGQTDANGGAEERSDVLLT